LEREMNGDKGMNVIYNQTDRAHRDFLPGQCEFITNITKLYKGHEPEFTCGSGAELKEKSRTGCILILPACEGCNARGD